MGLRGQNIRTVQPKKRKRASGQGGASSDEEDGEEEGEEPARRKRGRPRQPSPHTPTRQQTSMRRKQPVPRRQLQLAPAPAAGSVSIGSRVRQQRESGGGLAGSGSGDRSFSFRIGRQAVPERAHHEVDSSPAALQPDVKPEEVPEERLHAQGDMPPPPPRRRQQPQQQEQYRGVEVRDGSNPGASVWVGGKKTWLGCYESLELAAGVRDVGMVWKALHSGGALALCR